jgi:hypothetical protein
VVHWESPRLSQLVSWLIGCNGMSSAKLEEYGCGNGYRM